MINVCVQCGLYRADKSIDTSLTKRLQQRPAWRGTQAPSYIDEHIRFNQWFLNYKPSNTHPPIITLDTSQTSLKETAHSVQNWIQNTINN